MPLKFSKPSPKNIPLYLVSTTRFQSWFSELSQANQNWAMNSKFNGTEKSMAIFPNDCGGVAMVALGIGGIKKKNRNRFVIAAARAKLPEGTYQITGDSDHADLEEAALGWLLAGYRFDKYAHVSLPKAKLAVPGGVDGNKLENIAAAEALTRDLINMPSSDMGPAELEQAASSLAKAYGAKIQVIAGKNLLSKNFPMIHAVGRASEREPRLVDICWGSNGPKLTLVGKGVCFDTGGLNIKPGASMGLMKKDMGGAATVLGLAQMIMSQKIPVQLRVLIPAVENSISANAFRPQDILTSRKGLTVEINNTDAEGRLVLADALTYAGEANPDLIISMATLTGAARVAVGTDIAPFYSTNTEDADAILQAGRRVQDPVWQLPFWDPYETAIEPGVADLDNAPKGGMAGSITAALFLRRFVSEKQRYLHFDIYGWQPVAAPGRTKGGVGQGARAIFDAIPALLPV